MIDPKKRFANYQCPKCRGRSFRIDKVSVRGRSARSLFRPSGEPFIAVVCGLCGYAEFYSEKVAAPQNEDAPAEAKAPVVKESEL